MFADNSFMAFAGVGSAPAFYILAATVLVIILLRVVLRGPRPNLPPGPTGLPLIGSLHLLGALPHQSLAELAKKYGPLMSLRLGQAQCIVASSPETAMEFLHTQGANFASRPPYRAGEVVFYGQDIMSLNASDPVWGQMRTIFKTELTGPRRLEATRGVRTEEIGNLIRTLPQNCEIALRDYLRVPLVNSISLLMLNRRLSARVGGEHGAEDQSLVTIEDLIEISKEMENCLTAFHPGDFIPGLRWLDLQGLEKRLKDTNKQQDLFSLKIIVEHEAQRKLGPIVEEQKDMIHVLLDEVEKTDAKHQITMTNVKAVIWNGFFGGVDTILGTTEWVMSEVLRNPEVVAKAQAELDAVVGQHRPVQESDIPNLVYIHAIVNETLRLHPLAPSLLPHISINACQAFGYDILAKTRLFVNVWAIGRDPTVWPNAGEFTPARFLSGGANVGVESKGRHFELLPFGAGRRMCPGMGLGLLSVHHCVASLLHAYEWADVTNDPGMAERSGLVWWQLRTIIKRGLVGPKRLEATREVRAEEVGHLIRTLPQKCTIELKAYLIMMLNNIFSCLVNNRRLSKRGGEKRGADEENLVATKEFKEILEEMAHCIHLSYLGDYILGLKWFDLQGLEKRFKHTKDRMDSFALKVITEHKAERKLDTVVEEEKDLVNKLVDEVEKTDAKHQITMANVKAVMWDGFFGGKDPILGGIEWAMSEVLRKPEMVAKAQAELDLVVGQHRRIQKSDLPNLVYIQAIVSKTMRLHPPVPLLVPHECINPCEAFGYNILAKLRVMVNVWAIGRDPSVWHNAGEFTPTRFFGNKGDTSVETRSKQLELLPFSAGRRMCPDIGMEVLAMQYCFAGLLHAFE